MGPPVISDTGPIIHLDEADALSLLSVFESIHVPRTVLRELEVGTVPTTLHDLETEVHEIEVSEDRYPSLDPGETAAIRLANRTELILLTDDLDAREVATERGIEVHGSIGVVLFAHSRGRLEATEAKALLRELKRDTTLYLSPALVEHAVRTIDADDSAWE